MLEYFRIFVLNEQPAAVITKTQVDTIIVHNFGQQNYELINSLFSQCKTHSDELNYRVWAAILKLSNSNINELKLNIGIALDDYRDILSLAEYPNYSQSKSSRWPSFASKVIFAKDWIQYKKWLKMQCLDK